MEEENQLAASPPVASKAPEQPSRLVVVLAWVQIIVMGYFFLPLLKKTGHDPLDAIGFVVGCGLGGAVGSRWPRATGWIWAWVAPRRGEAGLQRLWRGAIALLVLWLAASMVIAVAGTLSPPARHTLALVSGLVLTVFATPRRPAAASPPSER